VTLVDAFFFSILKLNKKNRNDFFLCVRCFIVFVELLGYKQLCREEGSNSDEEQDEGGLVRKAHVMADLHRYHSGIHLEGI